MRYNLSDQNEKRAAMRYFATLAERKNEVEIKKVSAARTLNQNSYLHLIIGAFGAHFGYTLEEAKQVYKDLNSSIYRYERKGRIFYRSSADLDKDEMAKSIDHFMMKSAEAGYALPPADDHNWLRQIENEIEEHQRYL